MKKFITFLIFASVSAVSLAQCPHDSPCDALLVQPVVGMAVDLSNFACTVVTNEGHPPQGNCLAPGYWCDADATRTVWAKFTAPNAGSYVISTCNHGTTIDTQLAAYVSSGCFYTINCYDSYGDGWNDGYVTISIDGVSQNYTFYNGHFGSFLIPVQGDETITVSWQPGGWPEECSFELIDVDGNVVLNAPATITQGQLYDGTTICSEDVCNLATFQLMSANDDAFDGCAISDCGAVIPECVALGSAAFDNVIALDPFCCQSAWDADCQIAYDALNGSCTGQGNPVSCFLTLVGWDSYGDGWNDGFVTITVNGVPTNYTFNGGHSGQWDIPINNDDDITLSWTQGGWPEEAGFELIDASGNQLVLANENAPSGMAPVGLIYTGVASCQNPGGSNPGASVCYVNCIAAGTTVFIQVDGWGGQTGNVVLSVTPFVGANDLEAIVTEVTCPVGFGLLGEGSIIPVIYGWGTNYSSYWTGPDGLTSTDSYLWGIGTGNYTLNAEDACGNHVSESFVILGPDDFYFDSEVSQTCPGLSDGAIAVGATGGTAPYNAVWTGPGLFEANGFEIEGLSAGTYYLEVTDDMGCNIIHSITVDEIELPEPDLGADELICLTGELVLDGPVAESYLWSTGDLTQFITLQGSVLGEGEHTISLVAYNALGCSAEDSMTVHVVDCSVGVEGADESKELLWPNPTSELAFLSAGALIGRRVSIFSPDGRLVLNFVHMSSISAIDTGSLASGIYSVHIEGRPGPLRLVVRH